MLSPQSSKKLIVIAGPTAVGKTAVTIKLAKFLQCPVLSSDARQCYKELGVAAAKPAPQEQRLVKHYFINSHSIWQSVSAADYERLGLQVLKQVFSQGNYCIATGGSGLYIKALCEGLDEMPDIPVHFKKALEQRWQEEGLCNLLEELKQLDPKFYQNVDKSNHRRILRALEVCIATGKPYSEFRKEVPKKRDFEIVRIALSRDREELYTRIDGRVDQMIAGGLFEEAAALYDHRHLWPLKTVGYQEIFEHMEGKYDRDETIRLLKRNSRRYAKRQLTWFRKDSRFQWLHPDDWQGIIKMATS